MNITAIIPARSGSRGVANKNIKKICGKELLGYAIDFAKKINVDTILCSTDSSEYAEVAKKYGAQVPFLRSAFAASDSAMEEDILKDLYDKFDEYGIEYPDLFVWLRPTFIFREVEVVNECIEKMKKDKNLSACRVVTEAESRLYVVRDEKLKPSFDDRGKSMIRRQDVEKKYKVYNADVFRGKPKNCGPNFLGDNIGYVVASKLSGVDIDDETDFLMASKLIETLFI